MELKDILGIINASWLERMEYFLKKMFTEAQNRAKGNYSASSFLYSSFPARDSFSSIIL